MGATAKRQKPVQSAAGHDPKRRRIFVVDDHPLVRQGIAELINRQIDVFCCGGAANLEEAERQIPGQKPDLLLLDLCLGQRGQGGLAVLTNLKRSFAELPVLVVSGLDETIYAEKALRAGAVGFVMKEQATEELLRAIRTALNGKVYLSPAMHEHTGRRMNRAKAAL